VKKSGIKALAMTLLSCLIMASCTDAAAPTDRLSANGALPQRDVVVSGPQDIPLDDGESLPPEFSSAPLIDRTFLDVGFNDEVAYAVATMNYVSTHAKIELSLKLKKGLAVIDSASTTATDENLLPGYRILPARVVLTLPAKCGLRADAKALASAWMGFPVPKVGALFTWGLISQPNSNGAYQPECPPPPPPPPPPPTYNDDQGWSSDWDVPSWWDAESEDPYDGTCGLWQLWVATINGVVVDWWWDVADADDAYCSSINQIS
jgi:hypothetical protein